MLKWVRAFNRYDLYSKGEERPDVEALRPYYETWCRSSSRSRSAGSPEQDHPRSPGLKGSPLTWREHALQFVHRRLAPV